MMIKVPAGCLISNSFKSRAFSTYCSAGDGNPAITQDSIIGGLFLVFIAVIYSSNRDMQLIEE